MKIKMFAGLVALSTSVLLNSSAFAFDAQQDFEKAYSDYQTMLDSVDTETRDLSNAAFRAYETGKVYFGEDSINTANLAINYLKSVRSSSKDPETLQAMGALILDVYEKEHGKNDAQWLDAYVAVMSVPFSKGRKHELRQQYMNFIAPLQESNPQLYAVTLVDGVKLWHHENVNLREIIEPKLENLKSKLPKDDAGLLQLELYLAHYNFRKNRRDTAIEHYENVITNANPNTPESRRVKLLSHAALVELYERNGESDQATEHCVAIGATQPWAPDVDPEPLFRINPEYPRDYAQKRLEGSVQLKFDIDESGFVTNVRTIDSEATAPRFITSAEKSISKWRYAPKFENGQPVVATDQTVQLDFNIR